MGFFHRSIHVCVANCKCLTPLVKQCAGTSLNKCFLFSFNQLLKIGFSLGQVSDFKYTVLRARRCYSNTMINIIIFMRNMDKN